jgi:2-polyprenyl-6-methoxyphenol hydroxylase-like FAD-dependent oxidoreductase
VIKNQDIAVLIVGAGPTGLTLACDLARPKVSFRIVEQAPEFFAGSPGKGLQPRSLEVLDDLGVVDQILANGRFHLPFRGYEGATFSAITTARGPRPHPGHSLCQSLDHPPVAGRGDLA